MSSENEPTLITQAVEMGLDSGVKRESASLFMEHDEEVDQRGTDGNKRSKLEHLDPSKLDYPVSFDQIVSTLVTTGKIPPYDADTEGRPSLAIYHPSFKTTERLVTQVCDNFAAQYSDVTNHGYQNLHMHAIVTKSLNHWRSPPEKYPGVRPIAFLGPAGVGKSSAIICYLSQLAIAVENDSGDRGTNLVHEYSAARPNQTALFFVTVRYLKPKQISKLISKHCRIIYEYKKLSREDRDNFDDDETKGYKTGHDTALEFFRTLLCAYEEFETDDNASDWFEERKLDDEEEVVSEVKGLIDELLKAKNLQDMTETFEAETGEELSGVFQKFSAPSVGGGSDSGRKASLWPLIYRVEVQQDKDILNAGVVLGDAPGVTDTNQSVVHNTRNYLKTAGTILVFATPSRVTKNPALDANLCECIRLGKMASTYLIITNIDNKTAFKPTDKANLSIEDKEQLTSAESYVQQQKDEIFKVTSDKDSASHVDQFRAIDRRLAKLRVLEKAAAMRVKQISIEIRNRDIQRKLRGKFRELTGSKRAPDLKMFFTSNQEYQKHLSGFDINEMPTLDLEGTGVVSVRRMLYSVPAYGKFTTLSKIVRKFLPSIFNGITGILTKPPLERKQDVENVITKVLEEEEALVHQLVHELDEKFKDHILETIDTNEAKWKKVAESKVTDWQSYKSATLAAFCRRGGKWKPNRQATPLNWNVEIQNIFTAKLNSAFNTLEEEIDTSENDFIINITTLYQKLQDELEACEGFQGADQKPFFKYLHSVRDMVFNDINILFSDFKFSLGIIRSSVTVASEEFYVATAMQETYLECLKVSSTSYTPPTTYVNSKGKTTKRSGVHAARVELLRKRLTGDHTVSVFQAVAKLASQAFRNDLLKWGGEVQSKVGHGSDKVKTDFDRRFAVSDVKSEDDQEAVSRLQEAAKSALEVIEGEMLTELEKCEEFEKSGH